MIQINDKFAELEKLKEHACKLIKMRLERCATSLQRTRIPTVGSGLQRLLKTWYVCEERMTDTVVGLSSLYYECHNLQ